MVMLAFSGPKEHVGRDTLVSSARTVYPGPDNDGGNSESAVREDFSSVKDAKSQDVWGAENQIVLESGKSRRT